MANSFVASRAQLVYAVCLPLAVLLGYFLADPMDSGTVLAVGLVIGVLSIPIFIQWYHPMLVLSWNAAIAPVFFPGQAYLWTALAFIAIGFAVVNRFVSAEARFESVSSINWGLIILLLTVAITAWLRGGLGLRSLGSARYGGKNYFLIIAAILGYFALTSRRVPVERAGVYAGTYFLSGLTAIVPNLAYLGGPRLYFVFYIFSTAYVQEQAVGDTALESFIVRLTGLTVASQAFYCWLLARYGLRGLFDWSRPWLFALFVAACLSCLFAGFRSYVILFVLTLAMQVYFERLLRPRLVLWGLLVGLLACALILPNADKLPLVVQRSLSIVPGIPVNPVVRSSAEGSSEWRIRMWQAILPQVPTYLLKGKGYMFDPGEQDLVVERARRHQDEDYSGALFTGDYHNGPLTLIVPLGIWGVLGFGWFLVASWRYLYHNYRSGAPRLERINTLLLAYFSARTIYYLFVFGMFPSDLFNFTGIVGLAVCLNGARVAQPQESPAESEEVSEHEELALTARSTDAT